MGKVDLSDVALSGVAYCIMHPARLILLRLLRGRPRNITEICKETGLSRQLVTYHMSFLETHKLLVSEYKLEERGGRGYASRQYWCSAKVDDVIGWIIKKLSQL